MAQTSSRVKQLIPWALVFIAFAIVPQIIGSGYVYQVLTQVLIYTLFAMSINLLTGYTGLVSFGQAGFMAIGAYTSALLTTRLGIPFVVAFVAAGAASAIAGMLVGITCLRIKGHYLALITLAFGMEIWLISLNWTKVTNGINGIGKIPPAGIVGITFASDASYFYFALIITILAQITATRIINSRVGNAWQSIKYDEVSASTIGINVFAIKLQSFTVSSVYAGLAGSLYAHYMRYINPDTFVLNLSIDGVMIIVLGGLGFLGSPWLGASILIISSELLRSFEGYRQIIYGVVILLILIFAPNGLMGVFSKLGNKKMSKISIRGDA